jgi:hypothetical protein
MSQEPAHGWRWWVARGLVAGLTVAMIALTFERTRFLYDTFRIGWSWDLAYYNQWYWSMLFGDQTLTVRPMAAYATEGPAVWRMNYLSPLRFLLLPVYAASPGPRTLLTIHAVLFWLTLPAAFTLVRSESRSDLVALFAVALVPLTPLLWPLAWNDFREIQLCLPFVLWGVQGVRSRSVWLTAVGIAGMFACRQEMAVVVATFALLPAREPEPFARTIKWGRGLLLCGILWFLVFVIYLRAVVASNAPDLYLTQFTGPKAALGETLRTASSILFLGMGGWALLMVLAPRASILALPWLWGLASGKFALRFLATEQWHEVRYTVPFVATGLAAGLIGYGQLATWLRWEGRDRRWMVAAWITAAAISLLAMGSIRNLVARQPVPMAEDEVAAVWSWIDQVGPDDGALAVYEVTAPLSSRRWLYSYILDSNKPRNYPNLPPEIQWVFYRNSDGPTDAFLSQGFTVVHKGKFLNVLRRKRSDD